MLPRARNPLKQIPKPVEALLAVAALSALVTVVETAAGADRLADFCGPATVLLSGIAVVAIGGRWTESVTRLGWRLLGPAILLYGAGLLFLQNAAEPSLSLADPGNLLRLPFYPAIFTGIALVWRGRHRKPTSVPTALNAAVFSLALGAFAYELIFNGLVPIGSVEGTREPLVAFPLLDVAALMLLTFVAGQVRVGLTFPAVAASLVVLAVADVSFAADPAGELAGGLGTLGWPLGMLCVGVAAAIGLSGLSLRPLRGASLYAVGTAIFGGSLALLVFETLHDRDPVVIALACSVLCLAVVRFAVMARENDRLARDSEGILNAAGEGIYRVDASGAFTHVNRAALQILGYREGEVMGRNAHELIHHTRASGTAYPRVECPVCHTLKRGVTNRVTGEVYWRADGSSFPVDYTSAPIRDGARTVGAVVVFDDVTHQHQLEERLRAQATHDALTGLYNRRYLEGEISDQLRYARRYEHCGALVLLDLDAFKLVNDSIGHAAGDAVLCDVAAVLADEVAGTDVVARIGGDEFAVMLREADRDSATAMARRLIGSIRNRVRPSVGASAGIALFDGKRTSAEELLVGADMALLEVKEAGGGWVLVANGHEPRLTMVEKVREALAEERLTVYSQPIVDAWSGRTICEELLVRMLGPAGEVIAPDSFLPQAERFGLIQDIDLWVIGEAAALARQGRAVSVNLSGRSLGDPRIRAAIEAAVAEGVDPSLLWFEITETSAVANMADARQFATGIRELGCSLALDDFGTGFSSFAYLKNIPVQVLKIDMDFVTDLPRSPSDQHLVRAIVAIANSLGLKTVAEGVEDAEALQIVRSLDVDWVQGFHLGLPQPVRPVQQREAPPAAIPPAPAPPHRHPRHRRPIRTRRNGRGRDARRRAARGGRKAPRRRFRSPPTASRRRWSP